MLHSTELMSIFSPKSTDVMFQLGGKPIWEMIIMKAENMGLLKQKGSPLKLLELLLPKIWWNVWKCSVKNTGRRKIVIAKNVPPGT